MADRIVVQRPVQTVVPVGIQGPQGLQGVIDRANRLSVNGTYSAAADRHIISADCSSTSATVVLPDPAAVSISVGKLYEVICAGTKGVTLDAGSGRTVNGTRYQKLRRPWQRIGLVLATSTQWEMQPIGEDIMTVADFGAVGDGTTDDRAALQAAIDAMDAFGAGIKPVLHLRGAVGNQFRINAGLVTPADAHGYRIFGSATSTAGLGETASLLYWAAPDAYGSTCTASAPDGDGKVTITGLSGMPANCVGKFLMLKDLWSGANTASVPRGLTLEITNYVGADSVKVYWPTGSSGSKGRWAYSTQVALSWYARESLLEGLVIRPMNDTESVLYAGIAATQNGSNAFTSVEFSRVSVTTKGNPACFLMHGYIHAGPRPDTGAMPYNCENFVFWKCSFQRASRVNVWSPNTTGQSKKIIFDNCSIIFAPTCIDWRYGGFLARQCDLGSSDRVAVISHGMDQCVFEDIQLELSPQFVTYAGGSSGNSPLSIIRGRLDTSLVTDSSVPYIHVLSGGSVELVKCQFSGDHNPDFTIKIQQVVTEGLTPKGIIAKGCDFPNATPFQYDAGYGFVLSMKQCRYQKEDGTSGWIPDEESVIHTDGTAEQYPSVVHALPTRRVSSTPNDTVRPSDQWISGDTSDGEIFELLPQLLSTSKRSPLTIKNTGAARMMVDGVAKNIDGSRYLEIPPNASCSLLWNGTQYENGGNTPAATLPSAVDPADLAMTISVYEADSVVESGSRISQLTDKKVTNHLAQATGGNQALLVASMNGGRPGWRLVGSRPDFYECASFAGLSGQSKFSIFFVGKCNNPGGNNLIAEYVESGAAASVCILGYNGVGDLDISPGNFSPLVHTDPVYNARSQLATYSSCLLTWDRAASAPQGRIYVNGHRHKATSTGTVANVNYSAGAFRHGRLHDGQFPAYFDFQYLAVMAGQPTATQALAMHLWATSRFSLAQ